MPRSRDREIDMVSGKFDPTESHKMYEIGRKFGYLEFKKKFYKEVSKDGKMYWEELPKEKIKELENQSKQIVDEIVDKMDKVAVLREALRKLEPQDVKRLYGMIFDKKKKYKVRTVKTRESHCVDMKVGNFILPLIN